MRSFFPYPAAVEKAKGDFKQVNRVVYDITGNPRE